MSNWAEDISERRRCRVGVVEAAVVGARLKQRTASRLRNAASARCRILNPAGSVMPERWDCLIVGAGPAGLSAALYMARYHRTVLVLHDGKARALRIPQTHNVPGFPDGISGPALIERMTRHACEYGAVVKQAE